MQPNRLVRLVAPLLLPVLLTVCSVDSPTDSTATPSVVQLLAGNDQSAPVGTSLSNPFVVEVLGSNGRAVGGQTVAWAVVEGNGALSAPTSVTNASGEARIFLQLGATPGPQRVRASLNALAPVNFSATATAQAGAASLVLVSGNGQTGVVSATLTQPLLIRLLDAGSAPVAGATVVFTATGSNGATTPTSATTNANGEASASWRLGTLAGTQTVTASSSGVTTVSFSATATPGTATQFTIVSGNNQVAVASQALPLPVVMKVADAWDNAVVGTTVTFAVTSGGGSFSPATVTTDAVGRASASWTLGATMGAQGATASVAGMGNALLTANATPPIYGLNHRVVDAEYNAATNRIVTISANPSRLHIINPETREVQSIDLPQVPNAVSVRTDGLYAAVGHNAWVSYVNLTTRVVDRVYAVTTDAIDLVLANNGWAYVFPRTDQWVSIHSLNLTTGAEFKTGGIIRAGTLVKMHPSGNYIYGANNGLSPSDFEKYDIRSGAATVMYDSPYHGDYAFGGDVWISEDGLRLFARSGNVFRSSDVRAEDIVYGGNLQGMTVLQWVTQSTAAARVYALPGTSFNSPTPASEMRVYESSFLAYRGAVTLPRFVAPGVGSFKSEGRFVFSTTSGQRVYLLVKAENASGLALDWALVTYNLTELP